MMEFLPKTYNQKSTDLDPKKNHYVIRYIMGLTNAIAIQSNEHN